MSKLVKKEMELLLLKEICGIYETPDDVIHYIANRFYLPLCNARNEKVAIDKLEAQCLRTKAYVYFNGDIDEVHRLLLDPMMRVFDRRIVDDRLNKCILVLQHCCRQSSFSIPLAIPIFIKGLEIEHIGAFMKLYQFQALSLCPDLTIFLQSVTRKLTDTPTWDVNMVHRMLPFIRYYLDNNIDEPILEWLTIWVRKGLNVIKSASPHLNALHRQKLSLLIQKAVSPEMKRKRTNVIKYGIYTDDEIEQGSEKKARCS